MLVAAGFGTRLDPLTRELPKPALPVGNRPIAWYALDHLARSGFRDVVVNTHHLGARLESTLAPLCPAGIDLRFAREPVILGTAGGVRNAWRPQPDEDFVVMNAKLLFAPDLTRALAIHRQHGAIATMLLKPLLPGASFTPIYLESDGRIHSIGRDAPAAGISQTPYMFASVQILSARAWRDLPEQGDIINGAYRPWLARGEVVAGVVDEGEWLDVGVTLRHYLEANLALATGRITWPGVTRQAGNLLLADSARLGAGSRLEQCVVGDHVSIAPGAVLCRTVVWAGVAVAGAWEDAILTTAGQIIRLPPHSS
jgi:NDP-sugar pyrophosphorylase family protein